MLKKLCSELDGVYMEAHSSAKETAKELQNIVDDNQQKFQKIMKKQHKNFELYYIPLLLALLLFMMLHTKAIKYLVLLFLLMGINVEASVFDDFYLSSAYKSYEVKDFNTTKSRLEKIEIDSLQSRFALANTYYKLHMYKKAVTIYSSILSSSPKIKYKIYYNLANAYVKLGKYNEARSNYVNSFRLKEDEDTLHNLRIVALLERQKKVSLGIAHPKSQSSATSKSKTQNNHKESKQSRDEDKPSSGSGSGEESRKEKNTKKKKSKLLMDKQAEKQPISSKVYELINKGYIYETQPW
jgi:Ca-activated chloride channel family protein